MERNTLRTILFQMDLSRRRLLQPWFSSLGLTLGQGQPRILARLLQGDGLTQRELADMIHVSAATMANSLKRLERNGYIQRQSDEKDSRCNRIVITQKGLEAVERCQDAFDYVDTRLYAGFTPEEVERLKNAFRRMLQNMYAVGGARDTQCPPPPPGM